MDRKELEVEVERILLKKKARRRKLTKREELILAYTHYAAGCSTCYAMVKVQRYRSIPSSGVRCSPAPDLCLL